MTTRPPHHRPSGHVQQEPPPAPPAPPEPPEVAPGRPGPAPGWRIALFFWVTSFIFLLAYELLSALFRVLFR
jgi:hypothetical protein